MTNHYDPWDDSETNLPKHIKEHKRYERRCPGCKYKLNLSVYDDEPITCDNCGWMEQLENDDY